MAEFGKACEKLGVFIPTASNLATIFNHYDSNQNGQLEYSEFTKVFLNKKYVRTPAFQAPETTQQRASSPAKGTSTLGYQQMDSLIETLRLRLKARGARGIIGLGRAFRIMDDDHSRNLSGSEFTKAMHDYGTGFNETECDILFQGFDTNHNGTVDYDELLRFVRGPMNPFR